MKRIFVGIAVVLGLAIAYALAHLALIEVGREVIVLRTRAAGDAWLETRLWVVDDAGYAWLHGAASQWMANLRRDPIVEVERGGERHRYRAVPVPGPHPRIHRLFREKYGIADWWVRTVFGDEGSAPVRLEPLEGADASRHPDAWMGGRSDRKAAGSALHGAASRAC